MRVGLAVALLSALLLRAEAAGAQSAAPGAPAQAPTSADAKGSAAPANAAHAAASGPPNGAEAPASSWPDGDLGGIERPAAPPGDLAREAAGPLLYLPRKTVELFFEASGAAAGLVQDEQFVPRVRDFLAGGDGILVFPTAFAETGRHPSVGARMIAKGGRTATSLRAGFGGVDDIALESKVRIGLGSPALPIAVALETFFDRRSDLEFHGVGQVPVLDRRNRFREGTVFRTGIYRDERSRGILSLGIRPSDEIEVFLSTSLLRHEVEDADDAGPRALSRVFEPESIPGASEATGLLYSELALRLDTREDRGRPSPGGLFEAYAGTSRSIFGPEDVHFLRFGGRAAAFIPILKPDNILSPKIVVDAQLPLGGRRIPFTELVGQPEFRGYDTRRDAVSLVASLDYRWSIARYVAARVFVDGATVAGGVGSTQIDRMRFAFGIGLDVSSASTELGQIAVSASPEGANVFLSFGVPSGFGDRQHRD